jgi:hypothetical protein
MLPDKDFDRRDFIWTALGASAALAVSSPFPRNDHHRCQRPCRRRRHNAGQGWDAAGLSRDAGQRRSVRDGADRTGDLRQQPLRQGCLPRLAKAGYFAIAPDVYARKGDLTKISNIAD